MYFKLTLSATRAAWGRKTTKDSSRLWRGLEQTTFKMKEPCRTSSVLRHPWQGTGFPCGWQGIDTLLRCSKPVKPNLEKIVWNQGFSGLNLAMLRWSSLILSTLKPCLIQCIAWDWKWIDLSVFTLASSTALQWCSIQFNLRSRRELWSYPTRCQFNRIAIITRSLSLYGVWSYALIRRLIHCHLAVLHFNSTTSCAVHAHTINHLVIYRVGRLLHLVLDAWWSNISYENMATETHYSERWCN